MALTRRSKVESGFSMSSMTDIVFLLLIFFMITSTLVTPYAQKNIQLPESDQQTSAKPNTTISISKDLRYFIEDEEVRFGDIEGRLQEILEVTPETYVSLHVDESVPFSEVGKIRDIAIRNQYKLILATRAK